MKRSIVLAAILGLLALPASALAENGYVVSYWNTGNSEPLAGVAATITTNLFNGAEGNGTVNEVLYAQPEGHGYIHTGFTTWCQEAQYCTDWYAEIPGSTNGLTDVPMGLNGAGGVYTVDVVRRSDGQWCAVLNGVTEACSSYTAGITHHVGTGMEWSGNPAGAMNDNGQSVPYMFWTNGEVRSGWSGQFTGPGLMQAGQDCSYFDPPGLPHGSIRFSVGSTC